MGILNVTPDSFYDGGIFMSRGRALDHAQCMVAEGAQVIDVGGESTRPGASPVSVAEEIRRVVPVIEALREEIPMPISIDTSKPEVMRAAVAAGAGMINDVRALRVPGALEAAAELGVPICLMHMQGDPRTMQQLPTYEDVVSEVTAFLEERVAVAGAAGIPRSKIMIDPGFGFGKSVEHNLTLLRRLSELGRLDLPILAGLSRKSLIGELLDAPLGERLSASVTLALMALCQGASMVRVHDVRATRDAVRMYEAVYDLGAGS